MGALSLGAATLPNYFAGHDPNIFIGSLNATTGRNEQLWAIRSGKGGAINGMQLSAANRLRLWGRASGGLTGTMASIPAELGYQPFVGWFDSSRRTLERAYPLREAYGVTAAVFSPAAEEDAWPIVSGFEYSPYASPLTAPTPSVLAFRTPLLGPFPRYSIVGLRTGRPADLSATQLNIWPNPARGYVSLTAPTGSTVEIISLTGQRLISQPVPPGATIVTVPRAGLHAGLYLVRSGKQSARLLVPSE
ncbi:MAG: T9SS type A sorting domain-containing protein [Hymenobacteraceae bacterium]|nr:T9SS type A sorting domain-containing protein [Hymenobacteraceae bacterium]